MSAKVELDISKDAKLVMRYQDTGSIGLQITDGDDVVQSLTGNTLTLDILERDYTVVETVTATLNDDEDTATFTIDDAFWDDISLKCNYTFRIRREVASEIKTIVNGEVIIK